MTCKGYISKGMQVPDYIEQRMKAIDPLISMVWNDVASRWQVQRRDPRTGVQHVVLTIRNDDHSFRPLDRRVIADICEADVYRKYKGRREKFMAGLIERDLKAKQDQYDKEKQAAADEQHEEIVEQVTSVMKKVDI